MDAVARLFSWNQCPRDCANACIATTRHFMWHGVHWYGDDYTFGTQLVRRWCDLQHVESLTTTMECRMRREYWQAHMGWLLANHRSSIPPPHWHDRHLHLGQFWLDTVWIHTILTTTSQRKIVTSNGLAAPPQDLLDRRRPHTHPIPNEDALR